LGASNGGTGHDSSTAANGTLLIGNGTGFDLATLTQGPGITITNSQGGITITSNQGTIDAFWNQQNGLLYPNNATVDFAVGGQSTASAAFAVTNISNGTPTATISANNGDIATYITGEGNLGTTNAQTLTLGGATTGDILID
ncbi:MAG TPA: hypothetical protein V6C65_10495, partial [Allocoleopsis sp.]